MAEGRIALEVVTPRGRALHATVDEVNVPSVNGEFGVLPDHLPLLAAMRTGLLSYRQGAEVSRVAVGPGFAEVGRDKVVILTDVCVTADQIDPIVARKELVEVQAQLALRMARLEAAAGQGTRPKGVLEQRDNEIRVALAAESIEDEEVRVLIASENWLAAQLELYGDTPPATMRPHEEWGPPPGAVDEPAADDAS
jgi:F-type H+-transporting ATPase subunit epsilon